jgi:chromosome segregation ATPase
MTLEELKNLREHYRKISDDAVKEVEKLRAEIAESKGVLPELEKERIRAAKAADEKAFREAKNKIEMHKERISNHEAVIVDLQQGHLIDKAEFERIDKELSRLQNRITNQTAARFMNCLQELRGIAAEYEEQMRECDRFGSFLQEKVYRKYSQFHNGNDGIEHRPSFGFTAFSEIVRVISLPGQRHSVGYGAIERRAANVLKADTAAKMGMSDKARKVIEGE